MSVDQLIVRYMEQWTAARTITKRSSYHTGSPLEEARMRAALCDLIVELLPRPHASGRRVGRNASSLVPASPAREASGAACDPASNDSSSESGSESEQQCQVQQGAAMCRASAWDAEMFRSRFLEQLMIACSNYDTIK